MLKNNLGRRSLQLALCFVLLCGTVPAWAQKDVATPIRVAVTAPVSGTVSKPGPGTPGWEEICRPEIRAVRQVLPSDKKLAYYGRWDKKDAHAYRTDRGAAYLKFNFTGDYVAVHLQNTGAKIWWRSSIDGDAWQRFRGDLVAPLTRKGKHTLAAGTGYGNCGRYYQHHGDYPGG
jgi:hypothetical protein